MWLLQRVFTKIVSTKEYLLPFPVAFAVSWEWSFFCPCSVCFGTKLGWRAVISRSSPRVAPSWGRQDGGSPRSRYAACATVSRWGRCGRGWACRPQSCRPRSLPCCGCRPLCATPTLIPNLHQQRNIYFHFDLLQILFCQVYLGYPPERSNIFIFKVKK